MAENKDYKIGIIGESEQGPITKVLEVILKLAYQPEEVMAFEQRTFQPAMVQENSLDLLLIDGRGETDEAYALALRKHTPPETRIIYFSFEKMKYDLQQEGIEAYDLLEENAAKEFMQKVSERKL